MHEICFIDSSKKERKEKKKGEFHISDYIDRKKYFTVICTVFKITEIFENTKIQI